MSARPTITVAQDLDTGMWSLYAHSYGTTQPAGDRLLRIAKGQPWPALKYECDTAEEAEHNALLLRQHIESWGGSASKAKMRKEGAD